MNLTHEPDTDLSTQQDEAILNALNFQPPCDGNWPTATGPHAPCDKAAQWQARFTCNCTRLWCDRHKDIALVDLAEYGWVVCGTCTARQDHRVPVKIEFLGPLSGA